MPDHPLTPRKAEVAEIASPERAVIVLMDEPSAVPTIVEGVAAEIWWLVDGERSTDEISELIASAWKLCGDDASATVREVVTQLRERGLLVT